jgi:hypothetical protein
MSLRAWQGSQGLHENPVSDAMTLSARLFVREPEVIDNEVCRAPGVDSNGRKKPPARAERRHLLCEVNAFIVKSLTNCVAFGFGTP